MDGKLPLFVASGIWSAMTPVHEQNLERLQVRCDAATRTAPHQSTLRGCPTIAHHASDMVPRDEMFNQQLPCREGVVGLCCKISQYVVVRAT